MTSTGGARSPRYDRRHAAHYLPRSQSYKPVEVADRDRRNAAEQGSQALLEALDRYFRRGGRG